jgi:GDPmannose 4,6-dehydratase
MIKTALVIGSEGQDGTLLKRFLHHHGYGVYGLGRTSNADQAYLKEYLQFDLYSSDYSILRSFVKQKQPSEIYYVAAFHHSSQEQGAAAFFNFVDRSIGVNQSGFIKLLDIVREENPAARIFYTSTSLVFSGCSHPIQTEETKPAPRCIYSNSKTAAMYAADYYRAEYGLFVSTGIMYNHESILRSPNFLSKKLVEQARKVLRGELSFLTVGSLSAQTDWGYAPDYVEAMHHVLQLEQPGDFIISSGKAHTVKDWVEVLFRGSGKEWQDHVKEDPSLLGRKKPLLIGDNSKIIASGWRPKVSFEEMVTRMYNNII